MIDLLRSLHDDDIAKPAALGKKRSTSAGPILHEMSTQPDAKDLGKRLQIVVVVAVLS